MLYRKYLVLALLCGFMVPVGAQAQNDLEKKLSVFTQQNGAGFLQPLADAFGANLNSALYHSAKIRTFGINVYVGLETVSALISDDQKFFTATTEGVLTPVQQVKTPTIFGSKQGVTVQGSKGDQITFPGGFDLGVLPVAVPQIFVGSILGTEAMARFLQLQLSEDFGDLQLYGFGVRHSISQYIPLLPVNIAASFYRQHFEVGDVVSANATLAGLQGSVALSILEIYTGVALEKSNLDISYDFDFGGSPRNIKFKLKSENSSRLTLGASVNLAIINIHGDYNFGAQNVISLGAGVRF